MNPLESLIIQFPLAVKRLDGHVWNTKTRNIWDASPPVKKHFSLPSRWRTDSFAPSEPTLNDSLADRRIGSHSSLDRARRKRETHRRGTTWFRSGRTLNLASGLLYSLHPWCSVERGRKKIMRKTNYRPDSNRINGTRARRMIRVLRLNTSRVRY